MDWSSNLTAIDTISEWSLEDELKLLHAIQISGFGNWIAIARNVPPYNAEECENHYLHRFAKDFDILRVNKIKQETNFSCSFHIWKINQMLSLMKWQEEPNSKRQLPSGEFPHLKNLTCSVPCAGYNNIRSDFMVEYCDNAENVLKLIGLNQEEEWLPGEDLSLISQIEYALLQSYNSCLRDRNYRKIIIRNHGLIDKRKTYSMLQRLEEPFGKQTLKVLITIMRFLKGPEFDFLVERLKYQNEIRHKLNSYIESRKSGLKFLNTVEIYKKIKNKRVKYSSELLFESRIVRVDEKTPQRKPTQPLALEHLPGYSLLNDDEKVLCSTSRIVPETYRSFKDLLINECQKRNGLKLAQARSLIKIDVNKTRKIYDYLISLKSIWNDEGS